MLNRHSKLNFENSIHFVTTVTSKRGAWFTSASDCTAILQSFEFARAKYGLNCFGYVLMPDHLHALLHQPKADFATASMMESFKKFTSRQLRPVNYPAPFLWSEHFDDMAVPGLDAIFTKLRYMHENPLRKGLCELVEEYLWSSARFYAGTGPSIITIAHY